MVYFIQSPEGHIKIGYTGHPIKIRLSALEKQYNENMSLLGIMVGSRKKEKELHLMFSKDRLKGEWFLSTPKLLEFIENNTSKEVVLEQSTLSDNVTNKLKELGSLIKIARNRRDMTALDLASRVGLDRRTLAELEKGNPSVSWATFLQVLDILGILRGIEEVLAPENDIEAIAISIYKTRRKMNKKKIPDEKVEF